MPKLIVAIDMGQHFNQTTDLQKYISEFRDMLFPLEDKNLISLDEAHLRVDPTDNSFRVFEFIGYKE